MGLLDSEFNAEELIRLAQSKSEGSRRTLVENISDLFLSSEGRLNEHERALMTDIMFKLIHSVEVSIRRELSQRLADSDFAPEELIEFLANDVAEVARPVLEKSTVLQDEELIEIIRNRSDAHRMAIAVRQYVASDVSDQLIEYGDEDVIEALIRNETAEISKKSMEYLVAESKNLDRFQEPLLNRQDLPAELAYRMYWWVSSALRRQILDHYELDSTSLDDVLEISTKTVLNKYADQDSAQEKAAQLVKQMAVENKLNIPFVIQCLRQEKIILGVAAISELAILDSHMVWRAFRERTGESIAVIGKAIDMTREEFASLFLLIIQSRTGGQARSTNLLKSILNLYDNIEKRNAQAVVRHWQRELGYQSSLSDIKETDDMTNQKLYAYGK